MTTAETGSENTLDVASGGHSCPSAGSARWGRLKTGNIVGVVDSYGAVHSEFTGDDVAFHAEHFPATQCQWRWNHDQSIWWISAEHKPDTEQFDAIQRHLTRKYGIRWWENGHHDIDHLMRMWDAEDAQNSDSQTQSRISTPPTP